MADRPFLKLEDIRKSHQRPGHPPLTTLAGVSLTLDQGQALAVTGPSGSGKSTLLHIMGALDPPTAGEIAIGGKNPFALNEADLARFRNQTIGFVFQDHHLLPQYTALENTLMPTFAFKGENRERRARDLLARVGLGDRLDHRPAELSGGERQRTAIARALINEPGLLLCDEPTGNLDRQTAESVAELLFELHRHAGNVMVIVTHSPSLADRCPARRELRDGALAESS